MQTLLCSYNKKNREHQVTSLKDISKVLEWLNSFVYTCTVSDKMPSNILHPTVEHELFPLWICQITGLPLIKGGSMKVCLLLCCIALNPLSSFILSQREKVNKSGARDSQKCVRDAQSCLNQITFY